jgi:hypothetical protein
MTLLTVQFPLNILELFRLAEVNLQLMA